MCDEMEVFKDLHELATAMVKTKHYEKIGNAGIFAIIQKARGLGIDIFDALNGGLYYDKSGKVSMAAEMMNSLIRQAGHSIMQNGDCDSQQCNLKGKRCDNGDVWEVSFTIEDAKRAGLMSKAPWIAHPKSMLFSRALSLLARQLFPDVIRNCYVEGELQGNTMETIPTEIIIENHRIASIDERIDLLKKDTETPTNESNVDKSGSLS